MPDKELPSDGVEALGLLGTSRIVVHQSRPNRPTGGVERHERPRRSVDSRSSQRVWRDATAFQLIHEPAGGLASSLPPSVRFLFMVAIRRTLVLDRKIRVRKGQDFAAVGGSQCTDSARANVDTKKDGRRIGHDLHCI